MSRGELCDGAGVFVEERREVREDGRRGVVGRWGGVCDMLVCRLDASGVSVALEEFFSVFR